MHAHCPKVCYIYYNAIDLSYNKLQLRGILSVITAGSPMVGTPINLVQGLIKLGLIKDLNLAITVRRPLEWLEKGLKERWSCQTTTEIGSYNSTIHRRTL